MIYGQSYKRSIREPTDKEKDIISKMIPRLCRGAKAYHKSNVIFAAIVGVVTLLTLVLGLMNGFLQILIFVIAVIVSVLGVLDSSYHWKNAKVNMNKISSGEYGIANGCVLECSWSRGRVRLIGEIGDETRTEVEFYFDKNVYADVRWVEEFVCVIVNKTAYIIMKSEKKKLIISDDVFVCS